MKLGGYVLCTKVSAEFELGVTAPAWVHNVQKCGIGLQRWKNQRMLSSLNNTVFLLFTELEIFRIIDYKMKYFICIISAYISASRSQNSQ